MTLQPLGPHIPKRPNFQKSSSQLRHMWGRTKCKDKMYMDPSTKTVKSMAPGSGVKTLGGTKTAEL